ncbi:hypothetical protein JCM10207_009255 [Rhodosporidiobolus poonsookiae]
MSTFAPLSPSLPGTPPSPSPSLSPRSKRVAIIGAGTSGLGALLALLDLPADVRRGWEVEVLERRADVGGVWLPDEHDHPPSSIPETPLYPALTTNTAVPTMAFTALPFPPLTPLFPCHTHIRSYLSSVVARAGLGPYLQLNTGVERAAWEGGRWVVDLSLSRGGEGGERERETREYDHLVVATGRYHQPHIPTFPGQDAWLSSTAAAEEGAGERPQHEIVHSLWYRGPERYAGRVVVVVGFGASGWDVAQQVVGVAEKTYHSYVHNDSTPAKLPPVPDTHHVPRISHLTRSAIHFTDGSTIPTPSSADAGAGVSIILCTGYTLSIPFLEPHVLQHAHLSPEAPPSTAQLTTNGSYLRPLYRQLLVITSPSLGGDTLPPNALAILGLPWFIAAAQSAYIQGLVAAHAFAADDPGKLLPRGTVEGALEELEREEERTREEDGVEPFVVGHKFTAPGRAESYQSSLLSLLRLRSSIPLPAHLADPSVPYVPAWRAWARSPPVFAALRKAYNRAVSEGVEERFRAQGAAGEGARELEEEWVRVMEELVEWGERREREDEQRGEGGGEKDGWPEELVERELEGGLAVEA